MAVSDTAQIVVIADEVIAQGFSLAGVTATFTDPAMVKTIIAEKDIALIIITRDKFERLEEETKDKLKFSTKPEVIVLSDDESFMKGILKEKIGKEI